MLQWATTEDLFHRYKPGKKRTNLASANLKWLATPWKTDSSYEAGYLAGFFDGEGSLSLKTTGGRPLKSDRELVRGVVLGFAQKPGPVLERVLNGLKDRGFETYVGNGNGVMQCSVTGGFSRVLRAIGSLRPTRLLAKSNLFWRGHHTYKNAPIVSVEYLGDREVVGFSTETETFIAEGFLSHNCDDQLNFPGATVEDGVCVGDQVAETLAQQAAERIWALEAALATRNKDL